MFKPFYFNLIRKYIICFGTLFNNLYITRTDKNGNVTNLMRVPITYGPRDKALARVVEDPNIDRPTAVYPLPMMSFEITGFDYDGSRKLQTVNRVSVMTLTRTSVNINTHLFHIIFHFNLVFSVRMQRMVLRL